MHYLLAKETSRTAAKLVVTLLAVSALVFALTEVPGDPARRSLGEGATPQQLALFRHEHGLDRPFLTRYADWLGGAVHGDLGRTYVTNQPVWSVVRPRLARSLALAAMAWLLMVLIGVPLGLLAGLRGGRVDGVLTAASSGLIAVPEFVAGTLLLGLFAVRLHWVPANSSQAGFASSPLHALPAYLLPAFTVALAGAVHALRLTRANARAVAEEPYVRAARLRGLSPARVAVRHVLPNAAPPVVSSLALRLAALVGGMVVAENVFGFPGLGAQLVDSAQTGDEPVVQAIVLIVATAYVLINVSADAFVKRLTP
jgi:peptide/nickel transport system permease protein